MSRKKEGYRDDGNKGSGRNTKDGDREKRIREEGEGIGWEGNKCRHNAWYI